jgi:hypothetical protein
MIRAGTPEEVEPKSGEWLFIDAGFSSSGRSCGVLGAENVAASITFSEARSRLVASGSRKTSPLNLLIEAPLSVAFNSRGNPTGRSMERLGSQHRYWYEGLGCLVMTSALYLLRGLHDSQPQREVRLFEGFVSFKPKGSVSSHGADVQALRAVVWDANRGSDAVIAANHLAMTPSDRLASAFAVAGMEFGLPPVVRAMANIGLQATVAGEIMSRRA